MRVPRKAVWLVAVVIVTGAAAVVAAQQRWIDPAYPYTACEPCHPEDTGFRPIELLTQVPPEVPAGEPFNVSLWVLSPWHHEIQDIDAALDISEAQSKVAFVGRGSSDNWSLSGVFEGEQRAVEPISINPGLSSFNVSFEGSPGAANQNEWAVRLEDPDGDVIESCTAGPGSVAGEPNTTCRIGIGAELANGTEAGEWSLEVELVDTANATGDHPWEIQATARYVVDLVQHRSHLTDPTIEDVAPFGRREITWDLDAGVRGPYTLTFTADVDLYHEHEPSESDLDRTDVQDRISANGRVGDEYVAPDPLETQVGEGDRTAFMRSWGKVTGFASLLMILPTFLFVGVFSKHNKYAMNRFFGNARNRVVWHAAVSWIIIMLAVVHTLLFLMEPSFDVLDLAGFRWVTGWAALAAMVGLGGTGLWQIPLTKQIGYRWWRWIHLGLAVSALVLSAIHTAYDGTDFAWLWP